MVVFMHAWYRLLRGVTAFVLAVAFGLFTVETAIADAHESTAAGPEATDWHLHGDAPDHAASHVPHSSPTPSGSNESHPDESPHPCHCIHSHGGLPASVSLVQPAPAPITSVADITDITPRGIHWEPPLRPPIV